MKRQRLKIGYEKNYPERESSKKLSFAGNVQHFLLAAHNDDDDDKSNHALWYERCSSSNIPILTIFIHAENMAISHSCNNSTAAAAEDDNYGDEKWDIF